jgi:prolyl 4-hydroxylase
MHYVIFRNFLAPKDCYELIALAKAQRLVPSAGFEVETGESKVSDYRTSKQTFFNRGQTPLITDIENRIADATGTPIENGEGLQLVHYPPGCYYKSHHDFYPPNYAGSQKEIERGGQRLATFMIYLNTVPKDGGGETSFFDERVMIRPEQGKALLFWNLNTNYEPDYTTFHEGLPPKNGYHKYICNKWIHVRAFT